MFCDAALAARIERAECRMVTECAEAISRRRPDADLSIRPIGGGVAMFTGAGSPLNKVAGLGFGGPLDEAQLDEIERAFAQRKAAVQVELSNLADPSIGSQLTRRGYVLVGFENALGLRLPANLAGSADAGIAVAQCDALAFDQWLDVVVTAFASPDSQGVPSHESLSREAHERIARDMAAAPGFIRYLARLAGVSAGGAIMRIGDGVAHLCGAATLPQYRRRGVQTALLATRLHEAAQLGCDLAVVTTLPGSKSQQNAQRHGFALLYTRAILVRETHSPSGADSA